MRNSSVDVLVTTVNCDDYESLLSQMNIQTSAMIGNQTNYNKVENITYNSYDVPIYSFAEKGVGLNRNNLLMRSKAEFCLFGDDDLIYVDHYEKLVKREFERYHDADVIIFNLDEEIKTRYITQKDFKVNYLNFMRFGAARIAIRRKNILLNGILFNLCFGGGTEHSNGEDTLFLCECLKHKLNVYAVTTTIAKLPDSRESTWFKGYNDKYFKDKGILYYIMSKKYHKFLCLQDAIRHKKTYGNNQSVIKIYKKMILGVKKISYDS